MEKDQETSQLSQVKEVLETHGAAVLGTFFVGGPVFFGLWIYMAKVDLSASPPSHIWAVPIAATVFCSLMVLLLPDPVARVLGRMFSWIPYV